MPRPLPLSTSRRRLSYVAGWRWGVICGLTAGIALGAGLVAGALYLGAML